MIIAKFYNIINEELETILNLYSSDERTKQHKDPTQNKGYALLVWFLQFYGLKIFYKSYITDGKDDSSCDIIFSNKTVQNEEIFYVIQSKYVKFDSQHSKEEAYPKIQKQEFGSTLNDFAIILSGERNLGQNINFNKKYDALRNHLENNGKVKFIFFTLASTNDETNDALASFNKNYAPNISLEVLDIERIRRDYIEFKYKEIKTSNPLAYNYSSEDSAINLPIERFKDTKRDIFEFEGRSKAYTLLLKPKTVYDLFKKYSFSLFFKNVRNPIHYSNYNTKIIDTLLKKPDAFWYFNNGITAITKILPEIGIHAKTIQIEGLQIINGAQTVYSIYYAYENATPMQRKAMDAYAKIALRLIGSSDEDFNLQITRYTNLQNLMHDRDFWANDEVQQRLQNESFSTNLWYEKRHDEFQLSEKQQQTLGIKIVSNMELIPAYIAFQMQKPHYAITRKNDIFVSRKDDVNGIYEDIFHYNLLKFEDIYASYFVLETALSLNISISSIGSIMFFLGFSKIILQKYYEMVKPNYQGKPFNLSLHLLKISKRKQEDELIIFKKILVYTAEIILDYSQNTLLMDRLKEKPTTYDQIAEKISEINLDLERIKTMDTNFLPF